MVISLNIQNYALIESLSIDMEKGFSVLTGETGAGKSIILGALSLILGQRSDAKTVKIGENKCVIEAAFDLSEYNLKQFFDTNDLEYDNGHCIIRREVYSTGKSRAFINDTPVSLNQLKELGGSLIDIHSQHQNLLLGENLFQLKVIDILAKNQDLLQTYKSNYDEYRHLNTELKILTEKINKSKEEADYLRFQYEQLSEAKLKVGEQSELESEIEMLTHAEEIKTTLFTVNGLLDGDQDSILSLIKDAKSKLASINKIYPKICTLLERLESDYIDLKDIAMETDSLQENISFDNERLVWVQDRLDLLYRLEQKHNVSSEEDLLAVLENVSSKLSAIDNSDEQLETLKGKIESSSSHLKELAGLLSSNRKKTSKKFAEQLVQKMKTLGMPNIKFDVEFTQRHAFDETGLDVLNYMFAANKNQPLMPVAEIASGGEISRLMLVIKSLIANATALPTIIFDEIDTGVSGDIADKMGNIMKEMSNYMQVLTITHLPQVAGKGTVHYRVYKEDTENSTASHIVRLNKEERIEEIARMLSGAKLTNQAIDNAKVLLGIN
ncbi:MAG: DNA repair protein RecN [Bacteroidales bacterium]|nr:DNA repair protein RecN [Bacteroidales bacterium]